MIEEDVCVCKVWRSRLHIVTHCYAIILSLVAGLMSFDPQLSEHHRKNCSAELLRELPGAACCPSHPSEKNNTTENRTLRPHTPAGAIFHSLTANFDYMLVVQIPRPRTVTYERQDETIRKWSRTLKQYSFLTTKHGWNTEQQQRLTLEMIMFSLTVILWSMRPAMFKRRQDLQES